MSKCALEFAHDAVEGQPCPVALRDGPVFLDSGLSGGCFDDG